MRGCEGKERGPLQSFQRCEIGLRHHDARQSEKNWGSDGRKVDRGEEQRT